MTLALSLVGAAILCLLVIWDVRRHLPRDHDAKLRKSLGASERHKEARWHERNDNGSE